MRFDPQKMQYDVVVAGGGIAGVMAAAAAAKTGAKTLLAEASTFLGGVVTMGPLEALMTPEDSTGTVIAGVAQEFLQLLQQLDPDAAAVTDTTGYCASIVPYDPESMKYALWEFLSGYGVDVLTETILCDVTVESGCATGVRLQTRLGVADISCKALIDATGNGRAAFLAGNAVMIGNDERISQPVTTLCRIANVDMDALKEYVRQHPEDFKSFRGELDLNAPRIHLWGFTGALKAGFEAGALELLRNEIHVMQSSRPSEVIINYSRMNVDVNDPMALSFCQKTGMKQVRQIYSWFRKTIPAFRDSCVVQTGYVGIRESGRVRGKYVLTKADILGENPIAHSVAMGAFPIDIHQNSDGMQFERIVAGYHIPMECLMAEKTDNLFLAGRCISTTFEANASCRISMTCMSTGHAAGVMAARWAQGNFSRQQIADTLLAQGAIL